MTSDAQIYVSVALFMFFVWMGLRSGAKAWNLAALAPLMFIGIQFMDSIIMLTGVVVVMLWQIWYALWSKS
jgi:hypothetical protein